MREIRKRTEPRMMNHMRAVSFILKFSGLTYLASYIEMDYVSWLNLVYRLLLIILEYEDNYLKAG